MGRRLPEQLCGSCYQSGLSQNDVVLDKDHPCKDSDQMPFKVDMCFYHDHADDEEKKSCQGQPREDCQEVTSSKHIQP